MTNKRAMAAVAAAVSLTAGGAGANHAGHGVPEGNPYAPYAFLIGDWDVVSAESGVKVAASRFEWAINQSYVKYSVATAVGDKEVPHFEGVLMWNGANENLDMLLMIDLNKGKVQEQGTLSIVRDGVAVRDIVAIYSEGEPLPPRGEEKAGPGGVKVRFRQTFERQSADRILTTLMRETPERWVPTFPGSDKLAYVRKVK